MKDLYLVLVAKHDGFCYYQGETIESWHTSLEEAKAVAEKIKNQGIEQNKNSSDTWQRTDAESKMNVKVVCAKDILVKLPYNYEKIVL